MMWVLRVSVIAVAAVATAMALTVKSIYVLFILCSDFVFVILFPQFVCVIHVEKSNTYGSLSAFCLGLFLRLAGGEPALGLPALIHYPFYDGGAEGNGQLFPFRTLAAIVSFLTLVIVSYVTDVIFRRGYLDKKWDVFHSVMNTEDEAEGGPTVQQLKPLDAVE